jgi:predicted secreted Zn-dependent protease
MLNRKFVTFCLLVFVTACLSARQVPFALLPTQLASFFREQPPLETLAVMAPAAIAAATPTAAYPMNGIFTDFEHNQKIAQPITSTYYDYYALTGSTADALRSEMTQLGPISKNDKRRYDAKTKWNVQWSYRDAMTDKGCVITSADSNVDITYTLPKWNTPSGATESLVSDWKRYMVALQSHEDGHRDHGVAAHKAILRLLNSQPTTSSCRKLEATVDTAIARVIEYYQQQDLDYDRITRHGQTQGAVFPA